MINLGLVDYTTGLNKQKLYWEKVKKGENHYLLLLQHYPVITLGRRTDPSHLLLTKDELKSKGIELFKIDRGGSSTYHGPGQLVGYVICKASRMGGIHALVSKILQSIHQMLNAIGIASNIDIDNPGIWTNTIPPRKLAAVGMQVKEGITMHGFAINIDLPLTGFSMIVPCGLKMPVSTIAIEKGERLNVDDIDKILTPILLQNLTNPSEK